VGGEVGATKVELLVPRDSVGSFRVYVSVPAAKTASKAMPVTFVLTGSSREIRTETLFAGPEK
jgi:hypothetical protein